VTAKKIGRNDPCPCGSGKKYKHCCMRKGRKRRRARASASRPEPGHAGLMDQIRYMARQVMSQAPPDKAQELQETLEKAEEIAAYEAVVDRIEAAGQALEAHRSEFENLMRNTEAAMERSRQLFSEERFAPMRFTVDDVHRAFEAVGYPTRYREEPGEEDMEILVAAILHLADDTELRAHLTWQLMMTLPDYVSAGRYLDGWLVQYSAFLMTEAPDQSNPFLFVMSNLAFEEWAHQVEAQQEALLHVMGIDRATRSGMSLEETEAWFRAQMADPAKKARLEAYYAAHPMMRDQAEAELMELEDHALALLERDDAECLYLSPEEVKDWLPVLNERLEPLRAQAQQAAERGKWPDPDVIEAMQMAVLDTAVKMAEEVFTPERIDELVAAVKAYRDSLHAAGEREAATYAQGLLISVSRDDVPPADNRQLVAICFASLRAVVRALAGDRPASTNTD